MSKKEINLLYIEIIDEPLTLLGVAYVFYLISSMP